MRRVGRPHRQHTPLLRALFLVLCTLGAVLAGVGWALSSPVGSSPDDDYHLPSIWCPSSYDSQQCTQVGVTQAGDPVVRVPALLAAAACFAGDAGVSGDCQDEVVARGTIETARVNTGDYPGGFYRVMHVFAGEDIQASVLRMRVVNVLIAVGVFASLALSGTRATRRIQLYTLTAVMVPMGWFFVASTNPSGWAVTGVTAFGFGLHSAFLVRGRTRLAANLLLAGTGAVLAASARGDAAAYIVLVAVAVCLLHWRTLRHRPMLLVVPLAVAAACTAVALSAGQVVGAAAAEPETARSGAEVLVQLTVNFPLLVSGLFGYSSALGWLDTGMPAATVCSVMTVIGFLGLTGARRFNVGKTLAVALVAATVLLIPFVTLYRARLFAGESVQPRYVLPLAPILLLLLLTGQRVGRGIRIGRWQALIIWLLLSLANAAALYTNLWRYVTAIDDPTLWAGVEWWWWSGWPGPITSWVVGSVGFVCFAAAMVAVSWRRPDADRGVGGRDN